MQVDELLYCKIELLEQVRNNTFDQEYVIEQKDEAHLMELVDKRQELIDRIEKVDHLLLESNESSKEDKIKVHKENIHNILKEIYHQDQQNIIKAKEYQQELQNAINHMNLGKRAMADGYMKNYTQSYGYFIDRKIGR